LFRILFRL